MCTITFLSLPLCVTALINKCFLNKVELFIKLNQELQLRLWFNPCRTLYFNMTVTIKAEVLAPVNQRSELAQVDRRIVSHQQQQVGGPNVQNPKDFKAEFDLGFRC